METKLQELKKAKNDKICDKNDKIGVKNDKISDENGKSDSESTEKSKGIVVLMAVLSDSIKEGRANKINEIFVFLLEALGSLSEAGKKSCSEQVVRISKDAVVGADFVFYNIFSQNADFMLKTPFKLFVMFLIL